MCNLLKEFPAFLEHTKTKACSGKSLCFLSVCISTFEGAQLMVVGYNEIRYIIIHLNRMQERPKRLHQSQRDFDIIQYSGNPVKVLLATCTHFLSISPTPSAGYRSSTMTVSLKSFKHLSLILVIWSSFCAKAAKLPSHLRALVCFVEWREQLHLAAFSDEEADTHDVMIKRTLKRARVTVRYCLASYVVAPGLSCGFHAQKWHACCGW